MLLGKDVDPALRLAALNALAEWNSTSVLDHVTGRFRDLPAERPLNRDLLSPVISGLIRDADPLVSSAALATAINLNITIAADALFALVRSTGADSDVRIQALNVLKSQKSDGLDKVINELLESNDVRLRIRALQLLAMRNRAESAARITMTLNKSEDVRERQNAAALLGNVGTKSGDALIIDYLLMLADHKAADIGLEIMEAAAKRAGQNIQVAQAEDAFRTRRSANADSDPTAGFDECFVGGDDGRGQRLFSTHIAAQCIRCHRIGKTGSNVGPNLDGVASRRDAKYLLRSIVAPSADIEEKYRTQSVVLSSGKVVQGVLLKKDDSLMTLADAQGKGLLIDLDDVDETFEQKISIMPEMTKTLSRREIRDLLAYLLTLKKK
ncbi:MAG: c-type cytochrome [Fuerstiella sp.]|nr:c-type cytochrome [Fuerstiella sp.]